MKLRANAILASAIALISTASVAFQSTDYQCVNDCTSGGSAYQYCQSKCSYDNAPRISNTDYNCQNKCTDKGYTYAYCKQACSY